MEIIQDRYSVSTDKHKLDIPYIHRFLAGSYWAEDIPLAVVEKSIEHSMCFGVYDGNLQVGFARVVTDHATFGYLADVFIDELHRGKGLSKQLIQTIMAHPALQGFRSWYLATKDAHGLYAQFGFNTPDKPERIMSRVRPGMYKTTNQ